MPIRSLVCNDILAICYLIVIIIIIIPIIFYIPSSSKSSLSSSSSYDLIITMIFSWSPWPTVHQPHSLQRRMSLPNTLHDPFLKTRVLRRIGMKLAKPLLSLIRHLSPQEALCYWPPITVFSLYFTALRKPKPKTHRRGELPLRIASTHPSVNEQTVREPEFPFDNEPRSKCENMNIQTIFPLRITFVRPYAMMPNDETLSP